MSSPEISSPVSTMSSTLIALPAEMLLQREALGRGVAQAEFQLRRGVERAVGEIAARLGAGAAGERRLEELRGQLHDLVQRLALLVALLLFLGVFRHRHAGHLGEPLDGLGKATPSVSMTKSKILPFLPEEKSNQACFWSLTKNEASSPC